MERLTDPRDMVRHIVDRTGGDIRLALPLGLGKPVTIVNALVEEAVRDPSVNLRIFTALTLERPEPGSDMERRFLEPAMDRLFGAYPNILYASMIRDGTLPDNIEVSEFFLMAGRWLGVEPAQKNYISANYTHALSVLLSQRPNVLAQLVAAGDDRLSLSCNTDISADLFRLRAEGKADFLAVAETNPDLPFMNGDGAVVAADAFERILEPPQPFDLFSAVRRPVGLTDHAIGLHVSRLVEDGGTLQIGIGSVGDAVAHALILRHRGKADDMQSGCPFVSPHQAGSRFETGLYATTEMLVGGILELFEAGVIDREVNGRTVEAGFFVESRDFYRRLREMPANRRDRIAMVPVSHTNQLYGDEDAKRSARRKARFVNSAMKVSLLGDVMSDTLENGQVVSGVGGQFDFVEQAFALDGGHAVIALPATREGSDGLESNIRWDIPTVTIPRHMRDFVVTEYGIASLRGKSDAETIVALVAIADSRFQDRLIADAKKAGKLDRSFELPAAARNNRPERIRAWLGPHRADLPAFPFGTDFDADEQELLPVLKRLSQLGRTRRGAVRLAASGVFLAPHPREGELLARMGFGGRFESLGSLALTGALRICAAETPQ